MDHYIMTYRSNLVKEVLLYKDIKGNKKGYHEIIIEDHLQRERKCQTLSIEDQIEGNKIKDK